MMVVVYYSLHSWTVLFYPTKIHFIKNVQIVFAPFEFAHGFTDMQIIFGSPLSFGAEGDRLLEERLYPVARPEIAAAIGTPQDLLQHALIEVATHRAGWPYLLDTLGVLPRPGLAAGVRLSFGIRFSFWLTTIGC